MEKCVFVTGHRPHRFRFPEHDPKCQKVKDAIAGEIKRLHDEEDIHGVWVGGAAGVDTWAGEIVLELQEQEKHLDLRLYVAIPFPGFGGGATPDQQERYQRILTRCMESVVICQEQAPDAYKRRDYYMVDHSICGIAVYDLGKSIRSGTGMTYNYAVLKRKMPMTIINPDTANLVRL